jgi:hypothetical protein
LAIWCLNFVWVATKRDASSDFSCALFKASLAARKSAKAFSK